MILLAVALVAASCAGVDEPAAMDQGSEFFEALAGVQDEFLARYLPDTALRGIVTAAAIDPRGRPVAPSISFAPTDSSVTVLVALGDVAEGSTLTVAWFRLDEFNQPLPLFSHEIAVAPSQRAYSIGLSQGRLVPGWYEVVASLGGSELATLWKVTEGEETAQAVGSLTEAGGAAETQPPAEGPSGSFDWDDDWWDGDPEARQHWEDYYEALGELPPPGPSDAPWVDERCHLDAVEVYFDPFEVGKRIETWVDAIGCDDEELDGITVVASIVGPSVAVPDRFDPCHFGISGESDMPGTEIHVVAWLVGQEAESRAGQTTIPVELAFLLRPGSRPASGSTVEPGDEITIRALATEFTLLGPGVRTIRVEGPEGILADEEFDTPDCLPWRHFGVLGPPDTDFGEFLAGHGRFRDEVTYRVPDDPPPVIVIRVIAEDAWGRRALGPTDLVFLTEGEYWIGTIGSVSTYDSGPPDHWHACTEVWDLVVQFGVAADGEVTGSGVGSLVTLRECHTYDTVNGVIRVPSSDNYDFEERTARLIAFDVRGTKAADRFELEFLYAFDQMQPPLSDHTGQLLFTLFMDGEGEARRHVIPFVSSDLERAEAELSIFQSWVGGDFGVGTHTVSLERQNRPGEPSG